MTNKPDWDYTDLAKSYVKRAPYAVETIDYILSKINATNGTKICDIGAGTGNLTYPLAERGTSVYAIEPNEAMHQIGQARTKDMSNVKWFSGTAEHTGQPDEKFDLVSFGSSFNVVDQPKALQETARLLKTNGWFVCLWNHRNLDDPIQQQIETLIKKAIDNYQYGSRRENQTEILESSRLFIDIESVEHSLIFHQSIADCVEAWRSHGTLQRQAGEKFDDIINLIEKYLNSLETLKIEVPYTTTCWLAQLK